MRQTVIIAALLVLTAAAGYSEGPPPVKRDCGTCHVQYADGMLLREPLSGLCTGCHPGRAKVDHKVDVVSAKDAGGLPLDEEGRMTCATCHDPHDRRGLGAMLRDEPKKLCGRCH